MSVINRIQSETQRPLLCYTIQTLNVADGPPVSIDGGDLMGFSDLIDTADGDKADVFLIPNGGSAEATEQVEKHNTSAFIL